MPPRFQRVLLVQPPTGLYRRDDRCQSKVEDQTVQIIFPPIDLASLAAVLRLAGADVRIADYPAWAMSVGRFRRKRHDVTSGGSGLLTGWDRYRADLLEFRPGLVLVNVVTATHEQDFQALALAKEVLGPAVATAAKGEFMDAQGEQALAAHPEVDYGLHGEAEQVLAELCAGAPPESLSGLIWRESAIRNPQSAIQRNPGQPRLEDLDRLPLPARDLLDNALYRSPETGNPLTVIQGHRGCPSRCIFCPAGSMSGYTVRYRSPARVMEEIEECVTRYGIREFLFHGDTFTLNKKWLLELCERIAASGHRIRWGCNSRVDTMDDERAAALRRAGCWVVAFGVESGDQEILDRMKKGQRVERAREAVAICKRHGLRTHAFFVIGTPWETRATLERTLALARELGTDFFDFNIAYPLPGTELHEIAVRDGLFECCTGVPARSPDAIAGEDARATAAEGAGYAAAAVRSYELTSAELTAWRKKALLSLYLRPGYILKMLTRAGSPRVALNYARAGWRRLKQLL